MTGTDSVNRQTLSRVMWADDAAPREVVESLWTEPDALVERGMMLKDGDRTTLVQLFVDTKSYVLKRFNLRGPIHTAAHVAIRSRAAWCWRNAQMLFEAGIPTPKPLAAMECRAGPLRLRSFFLFEHVEGQRLLDAVRNNRLKRAELEAVADQFATIWERLGELRAAHGDMKATNFIIDREQRMWLIDLDSMRVCRSDAMLNRERRKDSDRFMRNWADMPEVEAIFRARIDKSAVLAEPLPA